MKNPIPLHKSDLEATDRWMKTPVSSFSGEERLRLLEWTQDMHWEVGYPVCGYIRDRVNDFVEEINFVLESNDAEWTFNVIKFILMNNSSFQVDQRIIEFMKRKVENPTAHEKDCGLDEACKEYLEWRLLGQIQFLIVQWQKPGSRG